MLFVTRTPSPLDDGTFQIAESPQARFELRPLGEGREKTGECRLLRAWSAGDAEAGEQLIPLVFQELRRQASRYLSSGTRGSHAPADRPGA